jgi:hypothetical protein
VQIALDAIGQQDGPETLFALDAPSLHTTRAKKGYGPFEMSEADVRALFQMWIPSAREPRKRE